MAGDSYPKPEKEGGRTGNGPGRGSDRMDVGEFPPRMKQKVASAQARSLNQAAKKVTNGGKTD